MTHFEYIAVAFSLVLSLAGVRLLSGLSSAASSPGRFGPHLAWIVFALVTAAMVWWNFWSFREVSWHFFSFLFVLLVPASIYLQAVALVPEEPVQVGDWEAYFFAARRRFFIALVLFFVVMAAGSWLMVGFPLLHPARLIQAVALCGAIAGLASPHRTLHRWLPVCLIALLMGVAALVFLRPGSMTGP